MFVTAYFCRARPGKEETMCALYREWRRLAPGRRVVSTELLSNLYDPAEMIMLARFQDQEAAWAVAESPDYRAWYSRLVKAAETGPVVSQYVLNLPEGADSPPSVSS